jgi:serine/threonine protein kinase/tetratricopeptide (TPR) repeat protein
LKVHDWRSVVLTVGAPPDSEREGILGFECLHRVAQSYLGPLWIAADVRDGKGTLGLLRRLALPADTSDDARREIAALGRRAIALNHPNVVGVREVLEQGSELVIVYESVEAEPLRSLQSWANLRGLSFPVGVALRIIVDLLTGLAAVHELERSTPGITVCGGVSPDSVLIARDGLTRVCDPLIASGAALIESVGFNTAKLAYAAPEQVHAATAPTAKTDLFTCGAMLWELLASRRLLAGSRPAIERKLLEHTLPGLRASLKAPAVVSDELVALVERALATDPAERPASAAELARLLGDCGHELASFGEVAAFVAKLSGPRFDRRTASIRSRSSGTLALEGPESPRDLSNANRGKAPLLDPTSEVDTPRADPPSERSGSPPRPARSAPAAHTGTAQVGAANPAGPGAIQRAPAGQSGNVAAPANGTSAGPAHGVPAVAPGATAAANASRPAASALESATLEASARRAEAAPDDTIDGLEEWTLEESSPSSSAAPQGAKAADASATAASQGAAPAPGAASPSAPFAPAPVEPPGLGFAPAPGGRSPALWNQMVSPTPPVTKKRAEASIHAHSLEGLGSPAHPSLAASQPFANLTPPPFAKPKEGTTAAPSHAPQAPPASAAKPHDPFGIGAFGTAAAPAEGPLPFEHLLRSKRGPSQRPPAEPDNAKAFGLHTPPKSSAPAHGDRPLTKRPLFWAGVAAAGLVALGVPLAAYLSTARVEQGAGAVVPSSEGPGGPAAASAERPEPPATSPPAPASPAEAAEATRAAFAQTEPPAPNEAGDAGPEKATPAADAPASGRPPPAGAADFAAAKLDDSQLVVLFALEERTTLPTCAERLGDSLRKYSGNDMARSMQQVKAARRKLADGDAHAAHELACSAVAHSPRNPVAQRALAELALSLGDAVQAKAAVERALAQTPKDKSLIAMRGDVLAVMGDIAGGRSIWLRNAVARGNNATRTKKLANAYRKAGEKALAASDWADAATYFRRAVVLTHGAFAPTLGLSEALLGLNHSSAALVWAERAARAFPKDPKVQVLFGDALHENGQSEKARDAWQTALEVQPRNRVAARRLREGKP